MTHEPEPTNPVAGGAVDSAALEHLQRLAGPTAQFREHQLEAIRDLVQDGARVLCVQRTAWGKSAVYFVATKLLRERGAGPTLIVSPLLALMRNQIAAANKLGLRAHTVNSTNRDGWEEVEALLAADAVDLLLISPERLNNPQFRQTMLPLFASRVALLVVDEAHCISDWGHDFRPDYRRIADMLAQLPPGVGVLCTTATANDRVVADVQEQLRTGHADAPLVTYRGPLGRSSLRFEVVQLPAPADRLAWLATWLPQLPGSGIVYTLTKRDADHVAQWLTANGVRAEAYSGEHDVERRIGIEDRLLANDLKAVVATSALGMGYDKPDLGFVVHYQAPGSVISYYQQVGRAGRGVERAEVVLLRGAEDTRIQDFFIEQAFPRREIVETALRHLEGHGATVPELMNVVNLGKGRIEAMLKVLDVEGAVSRDGTRWVRESQSPWTYDADRYAHITALRRREQATMASFGSDGRCLMRALQEELDDPAPADCGRCAVCAGARFGGPLDPALVRAAEVQLRSQPLRLEAKKMSPSESGSMKKIPDGARVEEGRALARLGDGGWDAQIQAGKSEGRFSDELVQASADAIRAWRVNVAWVCAVPSPGVPDLASRVAAALGVPFVEAVREVEKRPPQREMSNAQRQVANVRGRFAVSADLPAGNALLVDDFRFSGWTLAMVGGQLRKRGASAVYPFTLATAF